MKNCPICNNKLKVSEGLSESDVIWCISKDHIYNQICDEFWMVQIGTVSVIPTKEGIKIFFGYRTDPPEPILIENQLTVDSSILDLVKNLGVLE